MERGKCASCGKKYEDSNSTNISNQNKIDEKCQILNVIQDDCIESNSKSNISETDVTQSESAFADTEDFGVILNSQEALLKSDVNTYGEVKVANFRNVIVGNVTYITGPIHIAQVSTHVEEHNITNQLYLNDAELETIKLNIISREHWMAQPPKQITPLPETAQYVIIAHTATEEGYTQPQNALLVKLIQTFHMESRNWDDISYNFLVGCDSNIYEGRGWNIQGAHTYGYNRKSICIAFIGCFMDHLPPFSALNAARKLICTGVKLGFISNDYTLVGHCQCTPIESPGVQLLNEIKKWHRWRELTTEDSKF